MAPSAIPLPLRRAIVPLHDSSRAGGEKHLEVLLNKLRYPAVGNTATLMSVYDATHIGESVHGCLQFSLFTTFGGGGQRLMRRKLAGVDGLWNGAEL